MPSGLKRYYGAHDLHFITCSCYRRRPVLGTARRRDLLLKLLEEVRRRHRDSKRETIRRIPHFQKAKGESSGNESS